MKVALLKAMGLRIFAGFLGVLLGASAVAADLQISQYDWLPNPVPNGAVTTFSIRATNNGAGAVNNAVVTIDVSDRFQVINAAGNFPAYCTLSGAVGSQVLTCNLPPLLVGIGNSQTFDYKANAIAIGTANTRAAIAAIGNTDNNSGNNLLDVTPTVRAGADLSATKTASAASVPAGGTLSYTLTARNDGPNANASVRVTDNLPAASDFQFQSASGTNWTCGISGLVVACDYTGAAVVNGNYPPITVNGKVVKATTGTITNTAFAASTDLLILDPNSANDTPAQVVTNILPGTDLQALKSMPSTLIVGDTGTITLTIRNAGPQAAPAGTTIVDTIDASLTIGTLPSGCVRTGQTVTCTAGALASPQDRVFLIPVTAATATGAVLTNSATITPPAGFTDADTSAASNTATAAFEVKNPNADLSIGKTKGPTPVNPGSNITSVITVRNQGPSVASYTPATPIRVRDTVTANETFVSAPPGWSCVQTGNDINCETTGTGTLGVGSDIVLSLVTQAAIGTDTNINNTACTDNTGGSGHTPSDPSSPTGNDCATAGTRATTETADLQLIKEVSLSNAGPWTQTPALTVATGNADFYIRLRVSNLSGQTARSVNVSDVLPNFINDGALVTGYATDSASKGSAAYTSSTGLISWTVPNLAVGDTETLIVRISRPVDSGLYTNSATASSPDTTETNTANNTSTAQYNIVPIADMTVNAKSIAPDPARVGVPAIYTVSVRNAGANPAASVTVSDLIDATRFDIISAPTTTKSGGSCNITGGDTVVCALGTMIRNEVAQINITVRPKYPFGGTVLGGFPVNHTNRATVTTTTLDSNGGSNPVAGNNFIDYTHSVGTPELDLAITKAEPDATFDPVRPDELLTYDIRASNFGPSRATDVVVLDVPQPPAGGYTMVFNSVTINPVAANQGLTLQAAPNASCVPSGGNVVCKVDNTTVANNFLDAGRQVVFRVTFTIGGTLPDAPTTFSDEVQLSSAEQSPYNNAAGADIQALNNRAVQTTTVLPSTDLEVVSKTRVTGSPVNVNQPVEYTIRIRNNGPSNTSQVRVTDTLPSGFVLTTSPAPATAPSAVPVAGSAATLSSAPVCTGTTTILCILNGTITAGAANSIDLTIWAKAVEPYSGALSPTNRDNTASIDVGLDVNGDPLSEDANPANNDKTASTQVQRSSIAGSVYADNDRNDIFAPAERLTGVTVVLSGNDLYGNPISRTLSTDGSGNYIFDRLPPSDISGYTITETQPGGYFDRNETAGTAAGNVNNALYGNAAAQNQITGIVIVPNTNATGYIFQEVQQAALSGYIYRDLNNDGTRSGAGETGYAPASFSGTPQLRLTGTDYANNAVNLTATVDGAGFYAFPGLAPSDTVTGYTVTQLLQPNNTSDGLETNGTGAVIVGSRLTDVIAAGVVNPNANLTERNFGELPTSTLSGIVFFDPNNNATRDGTENAGLAGAVIRLQGTNDLSETIDCSITTSATGVFVFPKTSDPDPKCLTLRPGTYALTETPPAGLTHTGAYIGSLGGSSGASTGANTAAVGVANTSITNITITPGVNGSNYNFGESGQGISGSVYIDLNNNGVRDAGEVGIPGVTMTLSGITSTTQNLCSIITCTTTTDAAGNYSYLNMPGSDATGYTLTEQAQNTNPLIAFADGTDAAGGLGGSTRGTASNDVISGITIGSGELLTNYDFGELGAALRGNVYIDTNNDGAFATTEVGLAGERLTLSGTTAFGQDVCTWLAALTPARSCTTLSAGNGQFEFINLPAGTYALTELQPSAYADGRETAGTAGGTVNNTSFGSTAATNQIVAIALPAGVTSPNNLFGELGVVLSGRVFKDPQRDGVDSGGEPAIAGVTINLVQGGNIIASTTTDATGNFSFDDLPAGTYAVEEVQPAGYGSSTPNVVAVTLVAGGTQFVPFGETVSSIAGNVFVDGTNDGVRQSPAERGIPAATITLTGTDAANTPVNRTTTTAADGTYSFDDVLAGTYVLTESQPATYVDGNDSAGTANGTVGNDVISAIALPTATDATAYDFGERGQGLSGIVYDDRNRNGRFATGDTAIAGVTIQLQKPDGTLVATTTTGPDGRYTFPDIEAGDYVLVEVQPAGYGDASENNNNRLPFTVVAGTIIPDINFGERTGSIAGLVYNDSNGSGTRDSNEPVIPGTTITLLGTTARGEDICTYLAGLSPAGSCTTVTAADGTYSFAGLPGGTYTATETQPVGFNDGTDTVGTAGGTTAADQFTAINLPAANDATGYLFGERGDVGQISGTVWFDKNHDRVRDANEDVKPNWRVELYLGNTRVATATTDANGAYSFGGIAPGTGYRVRFINPEGIVFAGGRTNEANNATNPGNAQLVNGEITNITLRPGASVPQQSLPLDPSGVVYDSVRRVLVEGATVTFSGPAGYDPAIHLLGGTANVVQRTGPDGFYQYLLLPGAPAGTYSLSVTPPNGTYNPIQPSTIIPPCPAALTVGGAPDPFLVSLIDGAPALGTAQNCTPNTASTAYFLSFVLTPGVSANVLNNNIPIDPVLKGAIVVTKVTPLVNVTRGQLVPYTITAANTLSGTLQGITIADRLPAGFQYRDGSARLDGVALEPVRAGRVLSWPNQTFTARQQKRLDLILVVGSGVKQGEHTNQAYAVNAIVDTVVSDVAEATVRLVPDPDFDCTDILGKVFDDRNANGIQDEGEPGLPGVRLATARGLLITTDAFGRYHVTCPMIANEERGSNFILKLDVRTLPTGYRLTTENPETVRLTRGKFAKLNFGASLQRVVRVDISGAVFTGDTVSDAFKDQVKTLVATLAEKPSVLRIAYAARGETESTISKRMNALIAAIRDCWKEDGDRYRLIIEREITANQSNVKGDAQ